MAENMSIHLKTIEDQSKKLNAAADTLTKAVGTLNEQLAAMNAGVTVYYTEEFFEFPSDVATGNLETCRYYIGYDRIQDGVWGIAVMCRSRIPYLDLAPKDDKDKNPGLASGANTIRWIRGFDKCPRNVRLALCQYIPNVIEGLANALTRVSDNLEKSLKEIGNIQTLTTTVKK